MSRFDVECFDPPPDAELICCICQGVLDRPMETPCRHVFCKICIETWLRNGDNCPSCRAPVELDRLVATLPLLSNLLNKLRVYCVNRANNCQMSWFVESFDDDHAKVCEYRQVVCRFADCKTQVLVQNVQKHEDKCEYRPVICKKICGLTIIAKNKSTHACVPLLKETIDDLKKKLHESHLEIERLRTRNEELTDRLNDPDATRDTDIDSVLGWDPVDSNDDDNDDDDGDSFNSLADFLMSSSSNTHNSDQDVEDYSDGLSLNDAESSLTDSMVGFSESSYDDAYDPSAIMISSDSSSGYSTLRRPLSSPPPPRGSPGSQIFSDPDSVVYTTTDSPPNPSSPNGVTDFNSNSPLPSPNTPGSPGSPELDDPSRHSDSYCDVSNQSFALDQCDRSPSPASPPRASSSRHASSSSRGHVAAASLGHVSPATVSSRDRVSSPPRARQTSPRRKSTDDDDDSGRRNGQRSSRKRRRGSRRRDRSDDSSNSDRSRGASRRAKRRRRRSDSSDGDYRRRRYRSRQRK